MNVQFDDIVIRPFDKTKDNEILQEIAGNSKSKFIFNVIERLNVSSENSVFNNAYVTLSNDKYIGYIYLSPVKNDNIFIEQMIFKNFRNKGYGYKIMTHLIDYLFANYNLACINLSIDKDNIPSIIHAEKLNFYLDEDSVYEDKLLFTLDNPNYIDKKR